MLSIQEYAQRAGISPRAVRFRIKEGTLAARKAGNSASRRLVTALAAVALITAPAMASADEGGLTHDDASQETVMQESATVGDEGPQLARAGGGALFFSHAEYPHRTENYASGHGSWKSNSPKLKGKKATVKVWLEAKTADGDWITAATGEPVDVYAGGGKGKRGVANVTCKGSGTRMWRTVVDVDVNWIADTPKGRSAKNCQLNARFEGLMTSDSIMCDGEAFSITTDNDGQYHYDWESGPNQNYGFTVKPSSNYSLQHTDHLSNIRNFLSQIDPATGYIED